MGIGLTPKLNLHRALGTINGQHAATEACKDFGDTKKMNGMVKTSLGKNAIDFIIWVLEAIYKHDLEVFELIRKSWKYKKRND